MGIKGVKSTRTPEALQDAKGIRKCRRNQHPVKAPAGVPDPPPDLTGEALSCWNGMVPILLEMGTLTLADAPLLATYCRAHSRHLAAEAAIAKHGLIIWATGGPKTNPACKIAHDSAKEMRIILARFGCDPTARAGMVSTRPQAEDALSAFIRQRMDARAKNRGLKVAR